MTGGADPTLANDAGHRAEHGLDGGKSFALQALAVAADEAAVLAALQRCAAAAAQGPTHLDPAAFAALCLARKKELGEAVWTDAVKARVAEVTA